MELASTATHLAIREATRRGGSSLIGWVALSVWPPARATLAGCHSGLGNGGGAGTRRSESLGASPDSRWSVSAGGSIASSTGRWSRPQSARAERMGGRLKSTDRLEAARGGSGGAHAVCTLSPAPLAPRPAPTAPLPPTSAVRPSRMSPPTIPPRMGGGGGQCSRGRAWYASHGSARASPERLMCAAKLLAKRPELAPAAGPAPVASLSQWRSSLGNLRGESDLDFSGLFGGRATRAERRCAVAGSGGSEGNSGSTAGIEASGDCEGQL